MSPINIIIKISDWKLLGKTFQTITYLLHLYITKSYNNNNRFRILTIKYEN